MRGGYVGRRLVGGSISGRGGLGFSGGVYRRVPIHRSAISGRRRRGQGTGGGGEVWTRSGA